MEDTVHSRHCLFRLQPHFLQHRRCCAGRPGSSRELGSTAVLTSVTLDSQKREGKPEQIKLQKEMASSSPALWSAAASGQTAEVQRLLEHGSEIDEKTSIGETALYAAAAGGHRAVVELLLGRGATANLRTKRGTALYRALFHGHDAIAELLLDKRADVNLKNSNGTTALHFAARRGGRPILQLLLDKGADPASRNQYGMTPADFASTAGQHQVAALLRVAAARRAPLEEVAAGQHGPPDARSLAPGV